MRRSPLTLLAALVVLVACAGDDVSDTASVATPAPTTPAPTTPAPTSPAPATPASTAPASTAPASTVAVPAVPPVGEWERVAAPDDCACSDGTPYHYWVRPADPTRLVFFLAGGGACFSAETCGGDNPTFTPSLVGATGAPRDDGPVEGVFDADDERNPLRSYSMVAVPYCTGDLHLGDATHDYGDGVVIRHNGRTNAETALAAAAATFPDVEQVVVAGSSAGSAGAPLYAGLAHDAFPSAEIVLLADGSGAYPGDEGITTAIGALWGTTADLPAWPTSATEPPAAWSLPGLFVRAARHVPDLTVATINSAYDEVQDRFVSLIGFDGDLLERIEANNEQIEAEGVVVHSWIGPGTEHTVLAKPEFFTDEVDGVALHDWVAELVAGDDAADVRCTACGPGA